MQETASAIAGGDIPRGSRPTDERTEVGRLGGAAQPMLGQIERAFAEREATARSACAGSWPTRPTSSGTPLTSIRGYAEALQRWLRARDPDELEKAMSRIEDEAGPDGRARRRRS